MSTLFGEGSLVKKIITWVSAIIIVLPIVAYSTVEVAEAAIYDNIGKYENVDPSVPLKTSTRNPNKIVGLSMTEKKGVPIMRMNISASSDDVIKKGDQLDIKFSKKNVDTNKIKQLAAKDNNSLYNISKKGNDLVVNFKKDATSGNYQEVFAIATKNVKAHTKATASFAGKDIKIDNNNINSQYRAPQKQQTNQPQKVVNQNNNQQSTNNQQQSSTQAASSNDGESQATTSTGQTSQQQAAQQQQTQQVQQNQTVQNGGTTQQQANQTTTDGQQISPSFSQAEDAVNQRTTISVTGTATSDPTQKDLQATSSNVAQSETQTSSNTETPETQTTTSTPAATTQTQSNAATQATPQQTTPVVNTNTAATTQTTTAPVQTQTTQVAQPTQQTTTTQPVVQNQTTTFEPQQVSSTTSSTEASDNSGYTEIANSGYVSPKTTLDNYLTSDQDLDNNQVQNSEDTYEDNSQYEAIKQHVQQKAQGATQEEIYEITKDLPSIWHYIGTNDTDSDTEGQVWNFHSTLSTGRDLAVTIDGTAQPDSTDPLQQQMPELLRAMGKDIEPGALDEAVDIDALKNSQIYQDYLDGKYTGPNGENSASTSDAVNTVLNHTKISLDKPDNGAAITQLPDVAKVDPNMLLNRAKENAQNGSTTQTTADADSQQSQAVYSSIKQDTYNKMTPWASDDEKAEMLKSVPYIWNDASSKTNKDDKVGQLYNYVLNGTDGRQIYYTIDGRVIPNGNKYEKQFPNVIVSLGQNMTKGQFDPIVNNDILKNSKAYQDYTSKQNSQGNAATTAATTAATAAPAAGGLGIAPLLLGGLLPVVGLPLLLGGLALAPIATGAVLATAPIALALAQPVILPALALIPAITLGIPAITLGLPLTLGLKLAFAPIDLLNTFVVSKLASIVLTAPITIFNTIAGVTLGLINTVIGSIPLALFDFIAPVVLNFVIVHVISRLVQLTLFNTLLFTTLAKALINGAIDLALALSFIGLPIALIKGLFDLFRLGLGLFNAFAIPMLVKGLTFLALAPLALLNTIGLTLFNISIPMLLGFITSLFLSNLVGGLTFLTLLGLKLIKDLLKNGFQLLIRLAAVATILVGLPVLIVAAQILNFFILLVANAVGGLLLWGLLTLAKSLMLAGLGIALFSLPLLGQFAINTLVKWSIRALIHIFRFFVGLFKVGARLVLSFVLGLLNAIAGIAKAASVITAVVSGIAAALTALIPVVGPVLALLPLLISLLSIANSLILTPIKLLLGFLNLVVLGLNLLAIPVYLFIRPLISIALALGAGLLSDILMPLITLPLVLFNQLTLFNLIGLPLLLLNLLGTFLVEPLVLAGLGLLNALALPFLLALAALNLVALLGLVLLSFRLPLIALVLLALPSLIPFFNLIMDTIFLAPLVTLLLSVLNLFIGLPLMMLIDSIINLVVPFLVWLAGMILLAPIFGPLAFLNPLTWINLPLISIIGTFLTKLALKLISLPIIFLVNGLLSLIPAAVAAFVVGLLRALFGGLPFLLLAPLFLLPIILNGLLTALVPGLNLFTVPAALVALFLGLPLALLGLLNNLLGKAILRVLSFVLTYLASNVLKDLLALVGVPLVINLLTPLIFLTKLLTTQFGIFPALWLGLPLLAQLATKALLWGLTFIKGFAHVALDLLNIGATLLTLPLWTILPALNLLRRLALGFVALVSLPLRLLKDVFDIIRAIVEIGAILALPLLVGIPAFLLLLPLTTLNFLGMKLLNMAIPFVLSLLATLGASLIVNLLTFIGMLALHLFNKLLKLGAKLLLLGAITLLILGALPILIGAAVLNFFLLAALNLFIGFNAWLITTLFNNLLVGALLLGLLLLPLVSQLIINTVVKWTIRAVVHLIRFFVGLFRLGARLVLQFIIGLTNLVLGVTKAISVVAAVTNLLLAPISLLVPVVGPVLFLLHLLRAGLAGINFLILLPLKLLAGLLNLLTLGGLLLSIPYWLFIRPLTSVLLAIGAGILSDIVMTLLTLPLVLFNTLTLFNLIGIPALLLKAFNNLVVLPLLLAGIGLILAVGLPLALLLGALGLLGTLALGLLGLGFPLIALILLSLPNLIPFLDLILAALNLLGLFSLISSPAKLLLLPFKILLDLFNDFVLPLLVGGLTFLLLLPLLGIITFLNPLRWLNLGILSAIGTFLTKLLLGLLAIPFILVKNLLTSLIPAVLAGVLVGLLRALFGGLPFLLLALGLLLPLILNGLLTALIPGLNLLTVPLGLLALLLGLPLVALGILNNLLKQLVWTVLGTILTYLAFNLAKDLLDLLLWLPLQLLLALPLFLLNLALNAFILRPLLLFGLPLLAALLTNLALVAFNLIRRGLELLAELLTLGATLLTLPLWTIAPILNFLRRLLAGLMALRIARNLIVGLLKMLALIGLPLLATLLFAPIAALIGLGTFLALTALNLAIPFLLALGLSILIGIGVQILTTLALLGLNILNDILKNLIKLGLLAAILGFFLLVVVPLLVLGKILNFFLLLGLNAFIGFNIWLLSSLAKSLALALLAGGLFLVPLLGKVALAAVTAIAIKALVHLLRFFVGLFRLGARMVLSFILGLLRNLNRLIKLANLALAGLNAVLAGLSLLLPIPGWLLAPLFALAALLNLANWLLLIPAQLLLDLLGLLDLGAWLLFTIPYFLFVRPLITLLLAGLAGLVSHVISFLIGLPLFLLGQLLLQGLITLPLFLLKLFSVFVVAPLLINGLGLLLALGTSLAVFLTLLNLPILLFNALLGLINPLLAAILLGLPSLIPFFNLAMDLLFFVPLFLLGFNLLRLLLLPLKIFNDLIKNLLLPQLLFLLSLPINLFLFGPFNPLNWILAPALALLGTLLTQGLLRLLGIPFKLLLDALISLIPAALAGFTVGLLRALLGGLPFLTLMNLALLLPGLLLLPLIINGILTALIPGLNLLTVPLALLAALLNLPVLLGLLLSGLGILKNLIDQLFWGLLANVFTYFLSNLILDALAIVLIPLLLHLLGLLNFLPLTLFNLLIGFPLLLGLSLPLLAMLLNQLLLSIFNLLRRLGNVLLDLINIGLTLLTSPMWLLLPALHFLRRAMFWLNALVLVPLAFLKLLIDIGRQILHALVLAIIPLILGVLAALLAAPLALPINLFLKFINLLLLLPVLLFNAFGPVLISILLNRLLRRLFALAVIGLSILNYFLLFNLFLPFKLLQLLVNFLIGSGQLLAIVLFWNVNPILLFNNILVDILLFGIKVFNFFALLTINFIVGLLAWLPMFAINIFRIIVRSLLIFLLPTILVIINVAIVEFITMIVANIVLFLLHLLEDLPFTILHLLGLGFVVLSFVVQLLGLLPIGLALLLTFLILPLAPLGLLNVMFTGAVWFGLVAINFMAVITELIVILIRLFAVPGIWFLRLLITPIEVIAIMLLNLVLTPAFLATIFWFQVLFNALLTVFPLIIWTVANQLFIYPVLANVLGFLLAFYTSLNLFLIADVLVLFINRALIIFNTINYMWHSLLTLPALILVFINWLISNLLLLGVPLVVLASLIAPLLAGLLGFLLAFPIAWIGIQLMQWFTTPLWLAIVFQIIAFNDFIFNNITNAITVFVMHAVITFFKGLNLFILGKTIFDVLTTAAVILRLLTLANLLLMLAGIFTLVINPIFNRPLVSYIFFKIFNPWTMIFDLLPSLAAYFVYYLGSMYVVSNAMWPGVWLLMTLALPLFITFMTFTYSVAMPITIPINLAIQAIAMLIPILAVLTPTIFLLPNFFSLIPIFRYLIDPLKLAINFYKNSLLFGLLNILPSHVLLNLLNPINWFMYVFIPIQFIGNMTMQFIFWIACTIIPQFRMGISATEIVLSSMLLVSLIVAPLFFNSLIIGQLLFGLFPIIKGLLGGTIFDKLLILHDFIGIFVAPLIANPIMFISLLNMGLNAVNIAGRLLTPWWMTPIKIIDMVEFGLWVLLPGINVFPSFGIPFFWSVLNFAISFKVFVVAATLPLILFPGKLFRDFWAFNLFNFAIRFVAWNALITNSVFLLFILRIWQFIPLDLLFALVQFPVYTLGHFFFRILLTPIAAAGSYYLLHVLALPLLILNNLIVLNWILFTPLTIINILLPIIPLVILIGINLIIWAFRLLWTTAEILLAVVGSLALLISPLFALPVVSFILEVIGLIISAVVLAAPFIVNGILALVAGNVMTFILMAIRVILWLAFRLLSGFLIYVGGAFLVVLANLMNLLVLVSVPFNLLLGLIPIIGLINQGLVLLYLGLQLLALTAMIGIPLIQLTHLLNALLIPLLLAPFRILNNLLALGAALILTNIIALLITQFVQLLLLVPLAAMFLLKHAFVLLFAPILVALPILPLELIWPLIVLLIPNAFNWILAIGLHVLSFVIAGLMAIASLLVSPLNLINNLLFLFAGFPTLFGRMFDWLPIIPAILTFIVVWWIDPLLALIGAPLIFGIPLQIALLNVGFTPAVWLAIRVIENIAITLATLTSQGGILGLIGVLAPILTLGIFIIDGLLQIAIAVISVVWNFLEWLVPEMLVGIVIILTGPYFNWMPLIIDQMMGINSLTWVLRPLEDAASIFVHLFSMFLAGAITSLPVVLFASFYDLATGLLALNPITALFLPIHWLVTIPKVLVQATLLILNSLVWAAAIGIEVVGIVNYIWFKYFSPRALFLNFLQNIGGILAALPLLFLTIWLIVPEYMARILFDHIPGFHWLDNDLIFNAMTIWLGPATIFTITGVINFLFLNIIVSRIVLILVIENIQFQVVNFRMAIIFAIDAIRRIINLVIPGLVSLAVNLISFFMPLLVGLVILAGLRWLLRFPEALIAGLIVGPTAFVLTAALMWPLNTLLTGLLLASPLLKLGLMLTMFILGNLALLRQFVFIINTIGLLAKLGIDLLNFFLVRPLINLFLIGNWLLFIYLPFRLLPGILLGLLGSALLNLLDLPLLGLALAIPNLLLLGSSLAKFLLPALMTIFLGIPAFAIDALRVIRDINRLLFRVFVQFVVFGGFPGLLTLAKDLILGALNLIGALINIGSLLNLINSPLHILGDLLKNFLIPLLATIPLWLLNFFLFNPLNPINWLLAPLLAGISSLLLNSLLSLVLVPLQQLLNKLLSIIPALIAGLVVPLLRGLLGGLPVDILGKLAVLGAMLGLPLLNLASLIGLLVPFLRLLALPLLVLTQLAALPMLLLGLPLLGLINLDILRNLLGQLIWSVLTFLAVYPIALLINSIISRIGLRLLRLLLFLPLFLFNLFFNNLFLIPLLGIVVLPLIAKHLLRLAMNLIGLVKRGLNLLNSLLGLGLTLLTMPLWFNLPLLNILRRVAFWLTLLVGVPLDILRRLIKLLFNLFTAPLKLLALLAIPALLGLGAALLALPLLSALFKALLLPLLAKLLLPLAAILLSLPIKLLLDLLALPLLWLANRLLALLPALALALILPIVLSSLLGLIKLPLDLLGLLGLPLLQALTFLGKILALLNPLLWPLLPLLFPTWWILGLLTAAKLLDVFKDILGPLATLLLDTLVLLALPLLKLLINGLELFALINPLLWPLLFLVLLPLGLTLGLLGLPLALFNVLKDLFNLVVPALLTFLLASTVLHLINGIINLFLIPLFSGLLTLPLTLLNFIVLTALRFPLHAALIPALIGLTVTALLGGFGPLVGLLIAIPVALLDGLRFLIDDVILGLLLLPGLIPFRNLLLDLLFFIPLLLNLVSLFNLLRTPLKWLLDLFNQLALPLLVQLLTFFAMIPFFGLISLLNPFKWLKMALLSALTTFNVQLLATLFLLPLKLLNNKLLSLLPALLNGLLLGFLRNILGGLPLDILGLLALPLLNLLALAGVLTPGLRLLALPLLLLTQLLGLPLLLDTLRNLIAPLLWGNLAGLLTYPIAKLIKNALNLLGLPLLGLLATLPIFLLKLFNKAFVLRPLLLLGLPLLAGLLTGLVLPLFNLIRRAIKLGLNLLKNALALLTMPLWLGLPALNLLREALILPVLLLTLLRGLRNLFNTLLGLPGLLLGLPLLAGLATFLLGLPLITLLNMLLSMPLLALLLPLLAALPILPIKILLDLLLLPLVLLGNKLLGLPMAILAGLLLPLVLNGLFRHFLKLPFDLLKLLGLGLFNLLLPFIPLLNLLSPVLLPLGLLLLPLALADVLRDILGNLPFDLLNLLLILPLVQLLSTLAMLIPGLGLLLMPLLLPLKLFNRLIAIPLAFLRTLGDLAKLLLLALPLALLTTLLSLPLINLLNDALSFLLLPLLSGLLTLPLFLLNLGLATLLTFPIAKGVLPFLIANGLSALVANFLPVLIGLLLNPILVLANGLRLFNDLIKTLGKFLLLGALALPGLIPFRNLILDLLFLVPALINGLSLLNLLSLPFKFLRDLIKNNVLPLLVAGLTNLLLLPIFGPLQFLNPINWIKVPLLAALRTFTTKLLAKLFLVPGLILLNLLTSLLPATLAAIVVPFLRGLLGGLPLDILGLLGLPLLNLLALLGTLIPGVRLLALPLLLLTQLLGLPLLLDTLRNLVAPLLWGALAGLLTYPIANLVKDLLGLIGLPLLGLLTTLPLFFFKLLKNVLLGNVLALGLPLLNQALTFLALVPFNLLKAGLKLLNSLLPLGLVLLTMPLWFNLPLLNILRRVAFWLLLGLELLTLPFKLLRNILRTFVGLPMLLLGLPLLAGLLNFLFILPLVTLANMLLALPLPLTLLLPLLALLGNLPIKLLTDLLLLPLMFLINGLLALPLAAILGNLLPLVLGALNGLIKLPFDLLGLLGLPLLLGLLDLGKLFALLNPLLWPLLPIINVLRNILRMMIPFKLADVLKDILGPLSALPIDTLLALAIPALGLLTLLTMLNPIFWPLLPVLLPLALTLGLVGTPIALLRVLKDIAKLALPVLATMLLFPIIHTGFNILGLLALPLISGLLTLPLFLLNLGLKTLLTLPIVKSILPILINLGILLPLTALPALLLAPIFLLGNLVKGLRLLGDILATLLALPGVLKDLFDLVILPLKILIKPLLVLGLPLVAKVLTFLALSPLMLLNNLLAHLLALPLVGLVGLGNALLPLLVPFLFMNLLVRPLMIPGLMLLNGVILPTLLKLAIAIPVLGLLALPFLIGALTLPLFLLSLPIPLFNLGLQLLSLGMIIPGLLMVVGGVIALPFGLLKSLGGAGTPGTVIPGTPGTTPDEGGNVVPEPGYAIRQIPSVGFWVHNDPLVL